jgi:hypothetical protein
VSFDIITWGAVISFKEFLYLYRIDQIVVRAPSSVIPKAAILNEGKWTESGRKDWMVRVDAANPAIPALRHVHIARKKHISAKNQQASWNDDKTRHDKGSFNTSVGSLRVVQDLARTALGLDPSSILEHVVPSENVLLESATDPTAIRVVYLVFAGA